MSTWHIVSAVYKGYPEDGSMDNYKVGMKPHSIYGSVESIMYHEPDAIDNQHYCDITFADGTVLRIFDPGSINMKMPEVVK